MSPCKVQLKWPEDKRIKGNGKKLSVKVTPSESQIQQDQCFFHDAGFVYNKLQEKSIK